MSTKTYAEKLRDPRWQRKRLEVFQRDGWRCRSCNNDKLELHVHHLTYQGWKDPWDYPLENLRTLCKTCHEAERAERAELERKLLDKLKSEGVFVNDLRTMIAEVVAFNYREFQDALAAFLDSFWVVFENDWELTKCRIGEEYYIGKGGTFIAPRVSDESNNWGNRGSLLRTYRHLLQVIERNKLPIKPFFDDTEGVWEEVIQHELERYEAERQKRIDRLVEEGAS